MNYIKPTLKLSFGVASVVTTVLIFAYSFGFILSPKAVKLANRATLCEQLAVNCSLNVSQGTPNSVEHLVTAICKREEEILSGAVRDSEGKLLHEFGNHVSHWTHKENLKSTPEEVQVPIMNGDELWGTIELRYSPISSGGVFAFINNLFPAFIVLSSSCVFLLTFLYLARIFRRMYSSSQSEIPKRVSATLDTLVEGVLVLDKNKKIALANQAFAKSIGSTTHDLEGRKAEDLSWVETQSEGKKKDLPWASAMKEDGHQLGAMLSMNTEDGEKKSFSVNSTSIYDDAGNCRGALATFDDMTQVEERNVQLKHLLQKLDDSRQEVRKQNKKLKNLASKDPLTDCLNRRSFFEQFDIHWNLARRNNLKISCVMLDLDHFKSINDVHGHQKGDDVLKAVAQTLNAQLRGTDILCRYGGEEFCVLLPQMGIEGATVAAERFRKAVEVLHPGQLPVTISVGVTSRKFGAASAELLLEQADQALYASKKSGRNRVIRWDEIPESRSSDDTEERSEPDANRNVMNGMNGQSATPIPFHAVTSLITALAHRDAATATHSRRVADYCVAAARGLISESELYILELAALMHDIGKLGVPDAILLKPGPLTDEEWKVMGAHDKMGVDIISSAFNSEELSDIVRTHHAWYAGNPKKFDLPTGEDIPLEARILAIVDAYDAITSDRVYRKGRSQEVAFAEIRRCAGTQFDPRLVERFIESIMTQHKDESESVSHLSKQTALKIGLQIEDLANAVDSNDYSNLRTMAASLGSTAIEQGITSIAEVAVWLEHSTSTEQDPCEIAQLAIDLLDLCRESQRSYLNGCKQMEFSEPENRSKLEPAQVLA